MGKLTDKDWWLGRTEKQQERKQQLREQMSEQKSNSVNDFGQKVSRVGMTLIWTVTLPIVGFVFFGLAGLVVGLLLAVGFIAVRR